ncbi:unnamed protein product [Leptosia nina]|uniref:Uncharacterized protein n=1 Tax=Leptosia nina TaxID=320188 RepID=A0AAV1JEL8_9NEOP
MSVEVNAEPRIEVYEIRKTKDNRDVDTHYFDPDELRQDDYIQTFTNKKTNSKLIKQLTQLLSDGQRISDVSHSKTKKYKMDLNELLSFIKSGDDGHTLRDDDGSDFEDYTRSNPIVLLSLGSDECRRQNCSTEAQKAIR